MKNKLNKTFVSLTMAVTMIMGNTLVFASPEDTADNSLSQAIYDLELYPTPQEFNGELYNGHIELTGLDVQLDIAHGILDYDQSILALNTAMTDNNSNGETSNTLYFDPLNPSDVSQNIIKANVDFVGDVLAQPINVMMVMDQSGSMNMEANQTGVAHVVSPCMSPYHYYRVKVSINGISYYYMINPVEAKINSTWHADTTIPSIKADISAKTGYPINQITVTAFSSSYPPQLNHYALNDTSVKPSKQLYLTTDTTISDTYTYIPAFTPFVPSGDQLYYSPLYNNIDDEGNDITSTEDYISYLDNNNLCYDRMLVSKILFKDLSEISLEGVGNKIGYVQFAYEIIHENPLISSSFDSDFTHVTGYKHTNYRLALTRARELIDADVVSDDPNALTPKNFIIFVSDGEPYGTNPTVDSDFMKTFIEETDAIVYFAGLDLNGTAFGTWSNIIATTGDSEDESLAKNGTGLAGMLDIRSELETIINSASTIDVNIDPLFQLKVDENHPIELTWRGKKETSTSSLKITDIGDLEANGITYNRETGEISWYISQREVVEARFSYYQQLDTEKIDWTAIETEGKQTAQVLKDSMVEFVDVNGFVREKTSTNPTEITIGQSSQIRISNQSITPENVVVGDRIFYSITVTNTGEVDGDNLIIQQSIPEHTSYHSHTASIKTDSGATVTGIYHQDDSEIIFTIPSLKAGESVKVDYSVVADVYSTTINSVAKLGVTGNPITLDEEGTPILEAMTITHYTAEEVILTPTPLPTEDNDDGSRPGGGGGGGSSTPEPTSETTPEPTAEATSTPTATETVAATIPPTIAPTTAPTETPTVEDTLPTDDNQPSPSSPVTSESPEPTEGATTPEPTSTETIAGIVEDNDNGERPDDDESEESEEDPQPQDNEPPTDVTTVTIDGQELDPEDFTIDEGGNLVISQEVLDTLGDTEHSIQVVSSDNKIYETVITSDGTIPLSAFQLIIDDSGNGWSLFDLMMTVLSLLFTLLYLMSKPKEVEEEDASEKSADINYPSYSTKEYTATTPKEQEVKTKKRRLITVGMLLATVFSVILLFITQDFTAPRVFFDPWSIIFGGITLIQVLVSIAISKKEEPQNNTQHNYQ